MAGCIPDPLSVNYVQRAIITKRTRRNSQMLNMLLYKTAKGKEPFIIEQLNSEIHWTILLS